MTNLEAYVTIYNRYGSTTTTDAANDLNLIGIDPDGDYDPENSQLKCKLYGSLLTRLGNDNAGIQSVTEGGYSISYDKADKAKFLYGLALDSGCKSLIDRYNPIAKVKDASYLW